MKGSVEHLPRASTVPITGASTKPTPLRASTLPAGPAASDVASGSSNSQNDGQRNSRRPAGGPLVRQSTSHTLQETRAESNAIDPLSQHIIQRTNTQKSIPLKLLGRASYEEAGGSDCTASDQSGRGDVASNSKPKEKKYRVSLLNRIIGKKNNPLSEPEDETSETEENRMSADQSHPTSFIPRHLAPARYLKVRAHYKKDKTFDHVFEAQELQGAAPERPADRRKSASSNISKGESHGKAIWALAFSKDGRYLAAAGQDRKVRVWAVITSAEEREMAKLERETSPDGQDPVHLYAPVFQSNPIQVYEAHTGSILDLSWSKFHPRDDRFFLAGSLDTKLRLWSIPDKNVAYVTTVPDMITSVAFTPDGRHLWQARGRNSKGAKITGIDTIKVPQDDPNGDVKVLVTSNDSRIRLYDLRDRVLEAKFRGNENTCSQIRASFTDDGKHVICGSEDRRTYVWPIESPERDADKRPVEVFETQSTIVTVAITAPARAKQLLSLSEDPIYDICNPPPVNLASPEEAPATKKSNSAKDSKDDSQYKRSELTPQLSIVSKIEQESPAYMARSTHMDGNIIVIADYSGKIKILRQDCAYQKRRYENWDQHNTISRRILRRSNSARHSVASSIGKDSTQKTPSERIISWRNSVVRQARSSHEGSRSGLRSRSPSPHRQGTTPVFRLSSPVLPVWAPARHYRASPLHQGRRQCDLELQDLPASSAELIYSDKTQENPLWLQGDHSYAYWQKITQDAMAIKSRQSNDTDLLNPNHIPPGLERKLSTAGSVLGSEYESSAVAEDEEDLMRCENCLGTSFRGVKDRSGKQKLICSSCNRLVS
ncbi:hypothetical protein N7470_008355 [Penicillium chermesinum]|nr:hypothetical protein N7470_008355 [Penicillium chermesinum]